MLQQLLCFLGLHSWEPYESTRWGQTIYYRKCSRQGCRVRQRWHRNDYSNKLDDTGYWA